MNSLPASFNTPLAKRKAPNASANESAAAEAASANRRKRYARTKNVNVVWRANPETGEAEMLRFPKMGTPAASPLPAASAASPLPAASLLPASSLTPPPRRMLTRGTPVSVPLSSSPSPSNRSSIPESATPVRLSFPPMVGQGKRKSRKAGKKSRKAGKKIRTFRKAGKKIRKSRKH